MFGRNIYRHRLFESNMPLTTHFLVCDHSEQSETYFNTNRRGKKWMQELEVDVWRNERGVSKLWMTQAEARQSVPPYFTEYIGLQLKEGFSNDRKEVAA